ncbi:MAG TPA: hypothetical protein VFB28_04760 [Terriglobales bacterium]|nr:hypothetical protein [Terriglobales bacterium]
MNWQVVGFILAVAGIVTTSLLLRSYPGEEPPEVWNVPRLCLLSFLTLFAELAIIRWLGTEVRVFAYVKNLALLLCFLGFGLGCAISKHRPRWKTGAFALLGLILIVRNPWGGRATLQGLSRALGGAQDVAIWATDTVIHWPNFLLAAGVALVLLFLTTCVFIPLGQVVSAIFDTAPRSLTAYSWNVAASMGGILAFFVVAWLHLSPTVWLSFVFVGFAALQTSHRARIMMATLAVGASLLLHSPATANHASFWSPYQQVEVDRERFPSGEWQDTLVVVNHAVYQKIVDLAPEFLMKHPGLLQERQGENPYNLPFRFAVREPNVLVVGAGTGNDVAASVRNGSRAVDAVEIDPVILTLGKSHPEHPYDSSRVTTYVTDARAFMKRAQGRYDLVLFGLLDSHTEVSDYSNLRIDNFVYTEESFREAKRLLAHDGVMFIKFEVEHDWLGRRLELMLQDVFGKPPLVFSADSSYTVPASCFVISPSDRVQQALRQDPSLLEFVEAHRVAYNSAQAVAVTTDDWPYLYQQGKWIPAVFFTMSLLVIMVAGTFYWQIPDARRRAPSLFFFSMGAGFLLLETQVISRLALYFGTTWQVNGIVIAAMLGTILIANAVVNQLRLRFHKFWMVGGLIGGLLLAYFAPFSRIPASPALVGCAAAAVFAIPVFFAGMLFAVKFQTTESPGAALGANMLGAVVGGLLENLSLVFGMKALLLFALAVYAVAAVGLRTTASARVKSAVPG